MLNNYDKPCVRILSENNGESVIYLNYNGNIYSLGKIETSILKMMLSGQSIDVITNSFQKYSQEQIFDLLEIFTKLNFFNRKKKNFIYKQFGYLEVRLFHSFYFKKYRHFIRAIYYELLLTCIPLLIFSIYKLVIKITSLHNSVNLINPLFLLKLYIVLCVLSLMHEMGHLIIAYIFNYQILDIGLCFKMLIPFAFTKIYFSKANTSKKILFYLGGIIVNIQLAGIFSILTYVVKFDLLYFISGLNLVIVVVNLVPIFNNDGKNIMKLLI